MIQTNHSAAVSWPVAGSSSVAAVPPVLAVAPAAAASGDNRAGMEQAPDQPRQAAPAEPAEPAPTAAELQAQATEAQARREARAEAQRETVERLRETLRKVWDASGAVVEQALAREAERAAAGSPAAVGRALPAYEESIEPAVAPGSRVNRRV